MYKRILVPTDGSEITSKAVAAAVSLAKLTGAEVVALAVKEPFPYAAVTEMQTLGPDEFSAAQERLAAAHLQSAKQACADAGVPCKAISQEAVLPWEGIVAQCTELGCDLIVMASHGRRGVAALLLGSETTKVLTHTKVPVLVVR